jgi:gliding motility-associated-like protein
MKNKTITLLMSLFFTHFYNAQVTFYQDIYKGGLSFCGTSTADGSGTVNLPYYIEAGSTIRKVFLVAYSYSPFTSGLISNIYVGVNGIPFELNFDDNNLIYRPELASNLIGIKSITTHILDITNQFPLTGTFSINWPVQTGVASCPSCIFGAPAILILYENINLPKVNIAIEINDKLNSNNTVFNFNDLNPANFGDDVPFGIHSDRSAGSPTDGYTFKVNGTNIGSVSTSDILSLGGSGIIGSFYYQNGQCFGLTDDTPDDFINGSDGLVRINNYCSNTLSNLQINVDYIVPPNAPHNNLIGLYFAYSTPCDTFSVSVPSDTSICRGESLQLNVAGGSSYEWQPATNLSCSTCPNPVFTGDSTQLYTVRIWNNDSCSVVRPVKISVRNQPNFGNVNLTPSICGTNSGSIVANSLNGNVSPISFMANNGVPQASGSFSNLSEGAHTITLIDGNGCMRDSVVAIGQVNTTLAQFSANPNSGAVPFSVSLSNSSVFADQFSWSLNGVNQGSSFTNFTATQTGTYLIELIAWQFDLACADTATLSITAFDSLIVQVPNIITPNDDHINDFFTLTTNLPLKGTVSILNRWGEVVYTYKGKFQQGETVLWDGKFGGKNITEGTYFYGIELTEDPEFPLAIDKSQLPFKLDGFVEVRR